MLLKTVFAYSMLHESSTYQIIHLTLCSLQNIKRIYQYQISAAYNTDSFKRKAL